MNNAVWLGLAATCAMAVGGCRASTMRQGQTCVEARFSSFGELKADLPSTVSIPTAATAGRSALRTRGYVIVEERVLRGYSNIVGCAPGDDWIFGRTANFEARTAGSFTTLTIKTSPAADEAESRAILEQTLALIGR